MRKDDLILVIDMQNVYRKGEKWACLDTDGAAARILSVINAAEHFTENAAYEPDSPSVIFTEFLAPENPVGAWKVYNETYAAINSDPYLNDIVPALKDASRRYPLYSKSVYSSMKIPEVAAAARKAGRVVLTGVVSECCVLSTAFDAIDLGCHAVWLTDGVSGFDEEKEKAAELMLSGLSPVHTTLMSVSDYLDEI